MADFDKPVLDHLNLGVADIGRSRAFFATALAPLGITPFFDIPAEHAEAKAALCGFGIENDRPVFWLVDRQRTGTNTHVAFQARDRATVDAFYAAAMSAGGSDHGAPGLRGYHPNYYGAFVIDPDGNNIEAVCHRPE